MEEIVCFSGCGVNFYVIGNKTYFNIKEYCQVFGKKAKSVIKNLKDMGMPIYYSDKINNFATLNGYNNPNATHYGKHNYVTVEEIMANAKAAQFFNRNFLQDVIDKKYFDEPIIYDSISAQNKKQKRESEKEETIILPIKKQKFTSTTESIRNEFTKQLEMKIHNEHTPRIRDELNKKYKPKFYELPTKTKHRLAQPTITIRINL